MDKMKSIENEKEYTEQIHNLFREFALGSIWADTFEIDSVDDTQINITYYGDRSIKAFKKACKETLISCTYLVIGSGRKINIHRPNENKAVSPKAKKNIMAAKFFVIGMIFICIATAAIVVLCNYVENRNFKESFYTTSSIKVDNPVRVALLSDLHGASYGPNNETLLKRIDALDPDVIICSGDMVDSVHQDADFAVSLGQELVKIAPTYYIYGNNEADGIYEVPLNQIDLDAKFGFDDDTRDETAMLRVPDFFEDKLESVGIQVLKNEMDTIQVGTVSIDVYGVLNSNPSSFWSYSAQAFGNYLYENPDHLKITAVHEPFIFETYHPDFWGDLMVCGHTHGGIVRVPVLGPLYTQGGGLFPEHGGSFVYGRYDTAGSPLIVSGGLENSNILRINNQPELVIIDINKF